MSVFNMCRVSVTDRDGRRLDMAVCAVECEDVDANNPRLNRLADRELNRLLQKHGATRYYFHNRYSASLAPSGAVLT